MQATTIVYDGDDEDEEELNLYWIAASSWTCLHIMCVKLVNNNIQEKITKSEEMKE